MSRLLAILWCSLLCILLGCVGIDDHRAEVDEVVTMNMTTDIQETSLPGCVLVSCLDFDEII